ELLCHVREVDLNDTELAIGDDDGFLAIVMANRLPQYDRVNCKPVRYMACLVNLEGQADALPVVPEVVLKFDFVAAVQDVRQLAAGANYSADQVVMGTGNKVAIVNPIQAAQAAPVAFSVRPATPPLSQRLPVAESWSATQTNVSHIAV